jgi:SAM-dependent methyltransferase
MNPPRDEWLSELAAALSTDTFVKATLGKPKRSHGDAVRPKHAFVRRVDIQRVPHVSILLRYPNKDLTQNHPLADAAAAIGALLVESFANAHLFTTQGDVELRTNNKGDARLFRSKPTFADVPPPAHDRVRHYVLDPADAPFLRELDIVTADGKVRSAQHDKYRQLQSLLKILDDVVRKSPLVEKARLRVVDMGCGKGYLTFALYDYCNRVLGIETEVLGVDRNMELVEFCNGVARKLGFTRLTFAASSVEDIDVGTADIVVALHACDTATDVALFKAVVAGASIVIAVPCCQKELRPQLKVPVHERPLLKHDTFKDRYSQMVTDAVRGLLLESQGYRTRVVEFISDAHTHRNVMIIGVLQPSKHDGRAKHAEAAALLHRYGIATQQLETLLIAGGKLAPVLAESHAS